MQEKTKINKRKITRFILLILVLILAGFFVFRFKNRGSLIPQSPNTVSDTPPEYVVIKSLPEVIPTGSQYTTVFFDLNKEIDQKTEKIEVDPKADIKILVSPKTPKKIVLYPVGPWEYDKVYTVKINGAVVANFSFEEQPYTSFDGPESGMLHEESQRPPQIIPQDTSRISN